jgi:hypothetical protein
MSAPNDRLYSLLPSILRERDVQLADAPLRSLLSVISEQVDLIEANIGQLYDDWFVETCQDWVVPYIGDMIGYEVLHEAGEPSTATTPAAVMLNRIVIPRQDVANTVQARRRKGTLGVLVELARDVAGWPAVAVEFDRLAAITQAINDLRLARGRTVDVRKRVDVERIGSVGDIESRTAELRGPGPRSATGALPTSGVGLFVPRYRSYSVTGSTAAWISTAGDQCFTCSALANNAPLYSGLNFPRALKRSEVNTEAHYGAGKSLAIWTRAENDTALKLVGRERIVPANLAHWQREPSSHTVDVDAVLGRLRFPPDEVPAQVVVDYHYGFSFEIGAGEYDRMPVALRDVPLVAGTVDDAVTFSGTCIAGIDVSLLIDSSASATYVTTATDTPTSVAAAIAKAVGALAIPGISATADGAVVTVSGSQSLSVSFPTRTYTITTHTSEESHQRLAHTLTRWKSDGPARAVIEFSDSEVYDEDEIDVELRPGQILEIRAASGARPVIRIVDWHAGSPEPIRIGGGAGSALLLDGLLIAGSGLRVTGRLSQLTIRRSSLVPGWRHVSPSGKRHRAEPSIAVEGASTAISIESCILGPILVRRAERAPVPTPIAIADSIVDAFEHGEAIASPDARVADVELRIARATVFGRIRVHAVRVAENSIFDGEVSVSDRQHGCFRYCFLPLGSRTPQRYACQPDRTDDVKPSFVSTRFDKPGYARLTDDAPRQIAHGADDRAEMGAFHNLYRHQREANLRTRLAEYVSAGTVFDILFVS